MKKIITRDGNVWNNVPAKFLPKIPESKMVTYQIDHIRNDPFNRGRKIIPAARNVPVIDRIMIGDQVYDIGAIIGQDTNGEPVFANEYLWFRKESLGTITLDLTRVADVGIFEYFELCNYNSGNPNRDTGKQSIFHRVDAKADAKTKRVKRSEKTKAIVLSTEMTDDEVMDFALSLGGNVNDDLVIARDMVETYADEHPKEFLGAVGGKLTSTLANIKRAIDKIVILNDTSKKAFLWADNKEMIFSYPKSSDANESLAIFFHNTAEGGAVYEKIKNTLGLREDVEEEGVEEIEDTTPAKRGRKPKGGK